MTTNNIAFKTKEISASSRASIKIGESHFTFEASETRTIDMSKLSKDLNEAEQEIDNEWQALFDTVNSKVDAQIVEIKSYAPKK